MQMNDSSETWQPGSQAVQVKRQNVPEEKDGNAGVLHRLAGRSQSGRYCRQLVELLYNTSRID